MTKRKTTQAVSRLGDSTYAGRSRRPSRVAAGLATAGFIDAGLAHAGVAKPIVLVSGFWRSGTTWVQECLAESLGAKTIFEPLSPQEPRRRAFLASRFPGDEDALQAFIPGLMPEDASMWTALEGACRGAHGGAFLLSCRRSVAESWKTGIVVKDVRLHHNLAAFHRRFSIPIVHVRRHPCAVAASLIRADWHWSFSRVRLATLDPAARSLAAYDTDTLSRIAAYWAFVERRAFLDLQDQPWAYRLAYERLIADPARMFVDICAWLGRRQLRTPAFSRPAASIHPDAFSARTASSEAWRTILSDQEITRVEAIADALFPEWRATDPPSFIERHAVRRSP